MYRQSTDNPTGDVSKSDKAEYIDRLRRMAFYDPKDYLDIVISEDGSQKILPKPGDKIDWSILESAEITDGKVKIKFPDRTRAMEKFGKVVMEAVEDEEFEVEFADGSDA